jgi:hypothetical protein
MAPRPQTLWQQRSVLATVGGATCIACAGGGDIRDKSDGWVKEALDAFRKIVTQVVLEKLQRGLGPAAGTKCTDNLPPGRAFPLRDSQTNG